MTSARRAPALFVGADLKYMIDFRSPLIAAQTARSRPVVILAAPTPGFDEAAADRLGARHEPWPVRRTGLNPLADLPATTESCNLQPCPATGQPRGACPGYQVDHRTPLCNGGADRVDNLQWLSIEEHKRKTRIDVRSCRASP